MTGFSGAEFKSFPTMEDARSLVQMFAQERCPMLAEDSASGPGDGCGKWPKKVLTVEKAMICWQKVTAEQPLQT
ncbi:MAG: hypothetical protein ACLU4P_02375 [Ruminococcus sp.]